MKKLFLSFIFAFVILSTFSVAFADDNNLNYMSASSPDHVDDEWTILIALCCNNMNLVNEEVDSRRIYTDYCGLYFKNGTGHLCMKSLYRYSYVRRCTNCGYIAKEYTRDAEDHSYYDCPYR